ncbi:hypothetical protein PFICI_12832 [Pestalotiopsis fici W106-1]|uniref:Amidase domain-containing protein n=1 Tax=Pestalotiopsis fici (strain W106-1 / CGMCC3.15140) TaxID=1229662 RepID=W3WPV0_PESFW|nr:uncharacterized protein PFICI_12832 [Pestalotiopsis fici W106-1]ETS75888.1 hypothetical protein PFICI_12832 [Pestalotiopsis fici W106-1]
MGSNEEHNVQIDSGPQFTITVRIGGNFYLLDELKAVVESIEGEERYLGAVPLQRRHAGEKAAAEVLDINHDSLDSVWSGEELDFHQVVLLDKTQELIEGFPFCRHLPEYPVLDFAPHVIHSSTGRVFSVLKLCDDFNNAFVGGTLRDGPNRYQWLKNSTKIPVPFRRARGDSEPDFPLKDMRFGIKDVIDIAGLETGNGSKCYREFYPPRDNTAACIKRLTDAAAIMVGKLRCGQWCDGQDPLERMEEVTPTNPRGDGSQKPSGSSSGSAVACASYDWLDFTIGTDTGGSVRHPAAVNGVYGIRPSLGSMESSGLVCSDRLDTPGVFARSAQIAEQVCKVMLNNEVKAHYKPEKKLRCRLLYATEGWDWEPTDTPKFFSPIRKQPKDLTPAEQIMEKFVKELEDYLNCERQAVCIYDLWKATHPEGTSADLLEATGDVYKNIVYSLLWRNTIVPFTRDYSSRHGKRPFIEEITQRRLRHGQNVSDSEFQASVDALEAFSGWVNRVLLPSPVTDDDEVPILVYPQTWGKPQYRNDLGRLETGKTFWDGFSVYSLAYSSGCPDFTLPLGQAEFKSKITGSFEPLPVAISVMAPRGMDMALLKLVADLERRGILRPVTCGFSLRDQTRMT